MTLAIDVGALVADLHALAARSRALKVALTTTWSRSMRPEQKELVRIRRRTTELCILRALARGRFHLQKPLQGGPWPTASDREAYHRRVAERVAKDYALAPAVPLVQEGAS